MDSYGWPKDILHWKGIYRSILDIPATTPVHFVIADRFTAMKATARCMDLRANSVTWSWQTIPSLPTSFARGSWASIHTRCHISTRRRSFLGNGTDERIIHLAEAMPAHVAPFNVLPDFRQLQDRLGTAGV